MFERFRRRLRLEGLECILCLSPDEANRHGSDDAAAFPGLISMRFLRVYEIKDDLGLLTRAERFLVPTIARAGVLRGAKDRDRLWIEAHGFRPQVLDGVMRISGSSLSVEVRRCLRLADRPDGVLTLDSRI